MDAVLLGLLTTATGAILGALATWWAQKRTEKERNPHSTSEALRDKLHQLELRIVKLEAENRVYALTGDLDAGRSEAGHA